MAAATAARSPVTDLVSQGVVDPFEAVEVDEQHRDTRPVRADRCRAREAGVGPSGVAGLELIDGVLQHRIRPRRSDHGGSLPGLIAGLAPTGYRPFFPPGRISRTGGTNRGCKIPEWNAETGRELFGDSSGDEVRVPVSHGVHR
jgi:hypothetical protein